MANSENYIHLSCGTATPPLQLVPTLPRDTSQQFSEHATQTTADEGILKGVSDDREHEATANGAVKHDMMMRFVDPYPTPHRPPAVPTAAECLDFAHLAPIMSPAFVPLSTSHLAAVRGASC